MNAGRELDALIAERVMGWADVGVEKNSKHTEFVPHGVAPGTLYRAPVPYHSTDITAAFTLIDALMSGDWFSVMLSVNHESGWHCRIDYGKVEADGETAPLAICKAALAAVGVTA